jgi:4a-hydroxytetrahydrobiopterin dehydratase
MSDLTTQRCLPCEGGVPALSAAEKQTLLKDVPQWQLSTDGTELFRQYKFRNYYQTMAFVNALAWMAHQENHHPDLQIGYDHCTVRYSTHAIGDLTRNDFICAAKVDVLLSAPS